MKIKSVVIHMALVDPNDISKGLRQLGEYELEYEDEDTSTNN
jgi:hypothetical protein